MKDPVVDGFGRVVRKLRISVTDRCNMRCYYCMPSEPVWLPKENILTFEEITRVVRILAKCGVYKIKLTGGEPLVRRGVEKLVSYISKVEGIKSISMTTNGFFLKPLARKLRESGLKSVTISLPSLDRERFRRITGVDALGTVLEGIDSAIEVGFEPVKINTPVIKGVNEADVLPLAEFARRKGLFVRFIEFMPFDGLRNWAPEKVVSWRDIYRVISSKFELVPLPREKSSTSLNFTFKDSEGGVGFISSITAPFCSDCDRIRLTADGRLVPCMFGTREFDLKPLLRGSATDEEIEDFIRRAVLLKEPGVEYLIAKKSVPKHVRPMHTLGG